MRDLFHGVISLSDVVSPSVASVAASSALCSDSTLAASGAEVSDFASAFVFLGIPISQVSGANSRDFRAIPQHICNKGDDARHAQHRYARQNI